MTCSFRFRALALCLLLASTLPETPTVQARLPEVQGHRGARAVLPENTLVAFEYALRAGVDVLELDIAISKDGVPVVSHDPHLTPERCLGPDGERLTAPIAIRSLDAAEIGRYDCGSLGNPRFPRQRAVPGARVPTLAQVFDRIRASKHPASSEVRFNIETKITPGLPELAPPPDEFAHRVLDVLRSYDMLGRCTIQSFDQRTLLAVADQAPEVERVLLLAENYIDAVAAARSARATIVSPNHRWIDDAAVRAIHAAGLRVVPWTANTPRDWERLVELRVDGIITDDPAALIDWLKTRRRQD